MTITSNLTLRPQISVDYLAKDPVGFAKELARAEAAAKVQSTPAADAYLAQLRARAEAIAGPQREAFSAAYEKAAQNFAIAMSQLASLAGVSAANQSPEIQALYDLAKEFEAAQPIVIGLLPYAVGYGGAGETAATITGVYGMALRSVLYEADKTRDPGAVEAAKTAVKAYLDVVRALEAAGVGQQFWKRLPRPVDSQPKPEIGLSSSDKAGPATRVFIDAVESFKAASSNGASRWQIESEFFEQYKDGPSGRAELAMQELPRVLAQLKLLHPRTSLVAERFPYDMYRNLTQTTRRFAFGLLENIKKAGADVSQEMLDRTVKFLNLHYDIVRTIADPWLSTPDATMQELYTPSYDLLYGATWRLASETYTGKPGDVSGYPRAIQEVMKRETVEIAGIEEELRLRRVELLEQLSKTKNPDVEAYRDAKGYLKEKDIWLIVPKKKKAAIRAGLASVVKQFEGEVVENEPKLSPKLRASQVRGRLLLWAAGHDPKINMDAIEKGMRENNAFVLEMSQSEIGGRGVLDAFRDILHEAGAYDVAAKLWDPKEQLLLLMMVGS